MQENPTVDEVVHLPAGVTYWQKGTFRLYHHNPPLVKLVAALPVRLGEARSPSRSISTPSWQSPDPSQTTFSQTFACLNVDRYFELFQLARLMMPLFSIVGGSGRLRLVAPALRSLGRTLEPLALGLLPEHPGPCATDHVGRGLDGAGRRGDLSVLAVSCSSRAGAGPSPPGLLLGLAQLTKFSMLLLYAVWPFLWLVRLWLVIPKSERLAAHCPSAWPRSRDRRPEHRDDRRGLFLRGRGDSAR